MYTIYMIVFVACLKMSFGFEIDKPFESPSVFMFASYYQHNMVLQAEPHKASIWGYGEIDAVVLLKVNNDSYKTTVYERSDRKGVWSVVLDPVSAGTKAVIIAVQVYQGYTRTLTLTNVIFGDVWICSGQSNMVFPVGHMFNATTELNIVSKYPNVRIFKVPDVSSPKPLYDLPGIALNWSLPTSQNIKGFSAVCWLFGRHLYDRLQKPMGLILSAWGGTPVEAWSSYNALRTCHMEKSDLQSKYFGMEDGVDAGPPQGNSVLWNSMIHPFLPMTIRGAIWYQGEQNAHYHRDVYNCTFPAMISDWRSSWFSATDGRTDTHFPFGFVQLGTTENDGNTFTVIRWHQTSDKGYVPNKDMLNTFMAVVVDLPDPNSPYYPVHTRDKMDVGYRLSQAGLKVAYNLPAADPGPYPTSAIMLYDNILVIYPSKNLKIKSRGDFQLCCSTSVCDPFDLSPESEKEWLDAPILDFTSGSLILGNGQACSKGVEMIRYAWSTNPCPFKMCAVYNQDDIPGPPFVMEVFNV